MKRFAETANIRVHARSKFPERVRERLEKSGYDIALFAAVVGGTRRNGRC